MVESLVFVRNAQARHSLGVGPALERLRNKFFNERVGDEADDHANGNGKKAEEDSGAPHQPCLSWGCDVERLTANKDDQDLSTTHNDANTDEEPILEKTFENVELIVQTTVAAALVS